MKPQPKVRALLTVVLVLSASAAGLGARTVDGQDKPASEAATPKTAIHPRPISGFAESGVFKLFVMESEVGQIEYSLSAEGRYERKFTLSMGGQKVEDVLKIEPDILGEWQSMVMVAPTETVSVTREGDLAQFVVKSKNEKYSVKLTPGHILDDNYGPVFYSFMLRDYDMQKKGVQKFSRYVIPSTIIDFDLEYIGRETREVKGRDLEFLRYVVKVKGIELQILADAGFHIELLSVPVQKAAFVREGYEQLMTSGADDPLLSRPVFDVRKETVMIRMRDGVKLATDLYFPASKATAVGAALKAPDKLPVILIRTPYKKEMAEILGNYYAHRGYVLADQDCRGRFGSEGKWEPFVNEPKDGYDTIEWLASRDWASGKVGMIGGSYVGWVQLWAASEQPPHLTTIIPNVAPPDPFYNIPYEYGL